MVKRVYSLGIMSRKHEVIDDLEGEANKCIVASCKLVSMRIAYLEANLWPTLVVVFYVFYYLQF